jgi:hypothetical protein
MDATLGVLILLVHLGVLLWAISNKQPWWALGVFFFPLVGDLAYLIYYFSTSDTPRRSGTIPLKTPPKPGDTVTAHGRVYDRRGSLAMRRGEVATVTHVSADGKFLSVRSSSGKVFKELRPGGLTFTQVGASKGAVEAPERLLPSPTSTETDVRQALQEAAQLRSDGLITEEEFTAKRRKLLGLD